MTGKFYITTTLPYVNADPHIGFGLEIVQADVVARYHRLRGEEVIFNTGTDEHGQKILKAAADAGMEPQAYCDVYAARFAELKDALNLSYDRFIRTTDPDHVAAAQEFWIRCRNAGDIYKKQYQVKYCVGCELEKTDSELVEGTCPIHPKLTIEFRDEENYFFRWSKYQQSLLDHYVKHLDFVVPEKRLHEIQSFVAAGLQDFSISRLKAKMPWGVPVPGDSEHVMYVWFDALVNYISTLGWPGDEKQFSMFWPGVQVAGKDNLRQQSAMWQGMLLSAGLPLSKQIFIHGFFTVDGQKMSKSLGNVINPVELAKRYPIDALRYFLLREVPSGEDGDFSLKRLEERYESDLASGLGNLLARVTQLAFSEERQQFSIQHQSLKERVEEVQRSVDAAIRDFRFNEALHAIWDLIARCDRYIEQEKPWQKGNANRGAVLGDLVAALDVIATLLEPFMPSTAEKMKDQLGSARKEGDVIYYQPKKGAALFPRLIV